MDKANVSESLPSWMKEHIHLYINDPDAGHNWTPPTGGGAPDGAFHTLLLETIGRKSGNQLLLPLIYQPTGDGSYCIIASKGGAPSDPAWYLNLQANPKVQVQVAHDEFTAVARVVEGEERAHLWKKMSDHFSNYLEYQKATDRQIPVVVLEPI